MSPVASYSKDITTFENDGSRRGFGYLNIQNADANDITDFTRDRDGRFSRNMKYLPSGSMTYDVYSVNGQGTAGNFRAFRNDIGSVYDPYTKTDSRSQSHLGEAAFLNLFEAGYDFMNASSTSSSGPWNTYQYPFSKKENGNLYEPHYFKQAGELTEASSKYLSAIKGDNLISAKSLSGIKKDPLKKKELDNNNNPVTPEDFWNRTKRSNQFYFFTAAEASVKGVSIQQRIQDYENYGTY